jgi:hypothetical protein
LADRRRARNFVAASPRNFEAGFAARSLILPCFWRLADDGATNASELTGSRKNAWNPPSTAAGSWLWSALNLNHRRGPEFRGAPPRNYVSGLKFRGNLPRKSVRGDGSAGPYLLPYSPGGHGYRPGFAMLAPGR